VKTSRIAIGTAAVAAAILLSACQQQQQADAAANPKPAAAPARSGEVKLPPGSPQLKQIQVGVVETADVPSEVVTAPGHIELNPNRLSHVVPPLAGRITSVLVRLGDAVTRGQPVVIVESPDADVAMSAFLTAKAGVNTAKSVTLKAQADYDRAKDLYEHKAVAQKEVLNAEAALAQAKAGVEQADAAREQAQRRLDILGLKNDQFGQKITVAAPISGKVLEINVAPGEYRNDTNAPLMTIADLSTVWVASDVPETQIRFINPGEHLDIELAAYPGQVFHGRVTRIADTVDPTTRTVKVRAEMDNSRGLLRPEMFGSIRHVESMERLPVVPAAAVVQSDGRNLVYRETAPGIFEQVDVQLGNRTDDHVAVVKGLRAGERIVVDGVMLLKTT
jgi:cobalt-zinc-cadmium efflux system membrane fusion protein